jgi:hypothetical protein
MAKTITKKTVTTVPKRKYTKREEVSPTIQKKIETVDNLNNILNRVEYLQSKLESRIPVTNLEPLYRKNFSEKSMQDMQDASAVSDTITKLAFALTTITGKSVDVSTRPTNTIRYQTLHAMNERTQEISKWNLNKLQEIAAEFDREFND